MDLVMPLACGDGRLLVFPCAFPIKAIGRLDDDATPPLVDLVMEIVRRHCPDLDGSEVQTRESSGGKWLAVTLTVMAQRQEQLDAIYQDLTAQPRIVWAM